jgi:hypothetical protein
MLMGPLGSAPRLLVAAVFACGACVGANGPISTSAPTTPAGDAQAPGSDSPGDGGAGGGADGPTDASVVDGISIWGVFDGPAANCRWEGYGIGPLGAGQCDTMHLLAHSAAECFGEHGTVTEKRDVSDQCASEADEVQFLCCFPDGVPPAASTAAINSLGDLLTQNDPPQSRTEILARAADTCAQRGARLGDWSLRYTADSVTPDVLRFACH